MATKNNRRTLITKRILKESLLELMQKKYARYLSDPDDRRAVEKVTAALVRRGFTYQQIRFALEDYAAWLGAGGLSTAASPLIPVFPIISLGE